MKPHQELVQILSRAYRCPEFDAACKGVMQWKPQRGHIPRGFKGACGAISEVELVLVVAEPGNPLDDGRFADLKSAYQYLKGAYQYSTSALREGGKTSFHGNLLGIVESCWPKMDFERQMRKVWITESVLCSPPKEGGHVPKRCVTACGERYLLPQLKTFPNALVVALGTKAQKRLQAVGVTDFLCAYAVAPPGCNRREARPSWEKIPVELRRHRKQSPSRAEFEAPS